MRYNQVHIFGDSHYGTLHGCEQQDKSIVVSHYNLSPMTMYQACLLKKEFFAPLTALEGLLIFCFGEIDVRCLIHNQIHEKGRQEDEVISTLVGNFVDNMLSIHQLIAIMSVVPPIKFNGENYNSGISHKDFPFRGSDQDRSRYTRKLNSRLQEKCKEKDIIYINVYDAYKDEDGFLKKEDSDGGVHIGNRDKAYKLIKELNLF